MDVLKKRIKKREKADNLLILPVFPYYWEDVALFFLCDTDG